MMSGRSSRVALRLFVLWAFSSASAADIAIVDYADQWTNSDALRQTLDDMGFDYDDLTTDLEAGDLPLDDHQLFFIGSMTTNSSVLHQNLDLNADVIQDFVEDGGTVIETTQADQNEALVDWLPGGLGCLRSDSDSPDFRIMAPDHPLFNEPNEMREEEFQGWGHQRWPTVWEAISRQSGFEVLATSQRRFAILEASFGDGKFVMMALAPDKYHIVGNDDHTKAMAGLFMENILETYGVREEPVKEPLFRRSDADANGDANVTDAVFLLTHLFASGPAPACQKSADSDDNGELGITDAIFHLQYLFNAGKVPPDPLVECGRDGTPDELTCDAYGPCG